MKTADPCPGAVNLWVAKVILPYTLLPYKYKWPAAESASNMGVNAFAPMNVILSHLAFKSKWV